MRHTRDVTELYGTPEWTRACVEPVATVHPCFVKKLRALNSFPVLQKVAILHYEYSIVLDTGLAKDRT